MTFMSQEEKAELAQRVVWMGTADMDEVIDYLHGPENEKTLLRAMVLIGMLADVTAMVTKRLLGPLYTEGELLLFHANSVDPDMADEADLEGQVVANRLLSWAADGDKHMIMTQIVELMGPGSSTFQVQVAAAATMELIAMWRMTVAVYCAAGHPPELLT